MGRWCYFSTGASYKFWFSVQDSLDIEDFGGASVRNWNYGPAEWEETYIECLDSDAEKNAERERHQAMLLWAGGREAFSAEDIDACPLDLDEYLDHGHHWEGTAYEDVLGRCLELMPGKGFLMLPDALDAYIRSFAATEVGTAAMMSDIYSEKHFDPNEKNLVAWAKWTLGVVIAHQLIYAPDLSCSYEC